MNKVVISGVLQLLGFHLCDQCLNQGIEVVGFDTLERNKLLKEEMLHRFGRNANFQFVETNVESEQLKTYLKEATMVFYVNEECDDISQIEQIVEVCDQMHLPVVVSSSLEVYGTCETICKEDSKLHPITKFGKRKKLEEHYWLKDAVRNRRRIAIFRMPTLYGPFQDPNDSFHQVVYQFVKNHVNLDPIANSSSLAQQYLFVNNAVDAFLLMMNRQFSCEIYNLSANENKFCMEKIRTELNYEHKYTFREGLEIMKNHLLKILETNPSLYEHFCQ